MWIRNNYKGEQVIYYSEDEINKMQQDIEAYKQSEKEANEIIAELQAYKDVNEDFKTAWEELKAENERLKEEIKEVKKYQYEQEYLEKEIETAKVNLDIGKEEARHYLHEAYKFQKCLQEIKSIAERAFAVCDDDCGNANKFKEIIELTKAEEE